MGPRSLCKDYLGSSRDDRRQDVRNNPCRVRPEGSLTGAEGTY